MRTIPTNRYYPSMGHLLDVYDRGGRRLGFDAEDLSEYEDWKKTARSKLTEITGIDQMETCDLQPALLESVQQNGFQRDKMAIQTEPDVWMPFYLLVPDDLKAGERRPCVIAPHGHGIAGKYGVAGRTDIPAVKDAIEKYNSDYGVQFVKRGYLVFCPDARGVGERREWTGQSDQESDLLKSTCAQLNHMAISMGQSVTGMWVWDLMRLLDYIATREDCRADRIACCGLSGGGLQTLWLAALDDRVRCAVISGYFYGYRDSLLKLSNNCSCNYVPHVWQHVDMGDLGALIAPRPLLIETGDQDPLNGERGLANVTEQFEITNKAYSLLGAADKLNHYIFEGGHQWQGAQSYEFVDKWLQ
ncbi:dienelactone hydrolase family protein [Cohnella zeiphila]|uniref:Dienelactone hydrolase family protein n=1 Tax=Cohnella zeiphila TaxID=2761120 RepID=A0A7X0SQ57_9BACL|nr:alpha/beta hydrolase family protein [Cohnella zeiphila]MBB6734056.1 dienelactone hydrolase family protein [Cohnella zeiphila]